jgi:hypothetical protein
MNTDRGLETRDPQKMSPQQGLKSNDEALDRKYRTTNDQ